MWTMAVLSPQSVSCLRAWAGMGNEPPAVCWYQAVGASRVRARLTGRHAFRRRWDDKSVSPVIRQSLLHWAYELTDADFKRISKEF